MSRDLPIPEKGQSMSTDLSIILYNSVGIHRLYNIIFLWKYLAIIFDVKCVNVCITLPLKIIDEMLHSDWRLYWNIFFFLIALSAGAVESADCTPAEG